MNDQWRNHSARINPHTDPLGRCRYCGEPQPFHSATCRSLAAFSTERVEVTSNVSSLELLPGILRAVLKAGGSSSTTRGGQGSRTWSLTGSSITASRRLKAGRSGRGSQPTRSTSGTATTKTPASWLSSWRVDGITGTGEVILVRRAP